MANKWDEITQLEVAYDALKSQPREAQMQMLNWLRDRLASDYAKAMQERENDARARIAEGKGASRE